MTIEEFIRRWSESAAAERANKDTFLNELCDVLTVPRPNPAKGDPEQDKYVFERQAVLVHEDNATIGHIDLYKDGHFIIEAKQGSNLQTKRIGSARRGTPAWNIAMRDAYGQALGYAQTLDNPPPFIITTDIGYCFELYASFDGSGNYRAFPNARTNRIYLKDLEEHIDTLRAIFTDPYSLDPERRATKVTREVAGHLAELARALEEQGQPSERVAKFLMRCIFTMFAEDVGLLPEGMFARLIEEHWLPNPAAFPGGVRSLWKAMNDGGDYILGKLLKFNGGLFKDPDAVPMTTEHLLRLQEAARCDWSEVEPAIFGPLLERALDPVERHRLGAHYTPRAYVERLVRPTIEEPMRAEWDVVRAEVRQLVEAGKEEQAKKSVRAFYDKLCHTRVLDPACGTGNFLYVTLDLFKRIEADVVALLGELEEKQVLGEAAGYGVTPEQFLGIEVKPWAKEIAELVLWIGYLQWHFRTRGRVAPPEPVLRDYGNIECRDAVLDYDREELVTDERGRPVVRWNGRTYKVSPVTGEEVPDESATVPVYRYVNPRMAAWPKADFIVGNPPFMGNWRMRQTLGDGYVESLRGTYRDVPETADFVLYWWWRAAKAVSDGAVRRAGLITTNSISQSFGRQVVAGWLDAAKPVSLLFTVPDHPWVDSVDGADVRIAMTVIGPGNANGVLAEVREETPLEDGEAAVTLRLVQGRINPDLTVGVDVTSARPIQANSGVSCPGVKLHGAGFIVTPQQAAMLGLGRVRGLEKHIRPYLNGRDLAARSRGVLVIDLFGLSREEVQEKYPAVYQWVSERVRPERRTKAVGGTKDSGEYAANWWVFGKPRPELRKALRGLDRYIATIETSRRRYFVFLDKTVMPDNKLVVIASDSAAVLGVLSSRLHTTWALATGSWLGVGNDPVYVKTTCFETFPFPVLSDAQAHVIGSVAQRLDDHRKARLREHPELTLSSMYAVLAKCRDEEPLTAKEKTIHDVGLIAVLKDLHDELDAAVCDAYALKRDASDQEVLGHVLRLNAERAEEEARGIVRWLRPEFQAPQGAQRAASQVALIRGEAAAEKVAPVAAPWPKKLFERIAAVRGMLAQGASWTGPEVARTFKGAKTAEVEEVLQGLAALGLAVSFTVDGVRRWRLAGKVAA